MKLIDALKNCKGNARGKQARGEHRDINFRLTGRYTLTKREAAQIKRIYGIK